jgi:nucleoid-associated protein YgaU
MSMNDEMKARMDAAKKSKQDAEALKKKIQDTKNAKLREEILAKNKAAQGRMSSAPRAGATASQRAKSGAHFGGGLGAKSNAGEAMGSGTAKIIAHYTVKKGDTLSQIAKDHYGSGSQAYWKLIQEANSDLIKDANLIHPGQVFKIPALPDELKK